jgi:hypothetical protein
MRLGLNSKKIMKFPQKFINAYQAEVKVIDADNYFDFRPRSAKPIKAF